MIDFLWWLGGFYIACALAVFGWAWCAPEAPADAERDYLTRIGYDEDMLP